MISYENLKFLLKEKGLKRKDLIEAGVASGATLAKLTNCETVTTETIDNICKFLECQPGDFMEYRPETDKIKEIRLAKSKAKSQKDSERMKQRMKE